MFCKVPGSDEDWNFSACENKSDEILLGLVVEIEVNVCHFVFTITNIFICLFMYFSLCVRRMFA